MRAAILLASLMAFSAAADELHGGVSIGAGTTYDALGLRAEAGSRHFSLYAGFGMMPGAITSTLSAGGGGTFSAGVRWYSGDRSGWLVSANFARAWLHNYQDSDRQGPAVESGPIPDGAVGFGVDF